MSLYGIPPADRRAAVDGVPRVGLDEALAELEADTIERLMVEAPPGRRFAPGRPQRSGPVETGAGR